MVCKRCGKSLPATGITCAFCGAAMSRDQLNERKINENKEKKFQANLLSDRYGIEKNLIYKEKNETSENKLLGALIIGIILIILLILAILIYIKN